MHLSDRALPVAAAIPYHQPHQAQATTTTATAVYECSGKGEEQGSRSLSRTSSPDSAAAAAVPSSDRTPSKSIISTREAAAALMQRQSEMSTEGEVGAKATTDQHEQQPEAEKPSSVLTYATEEARYEKELTAAAATHTISAPPPPPVVSIDCQNLARVVALAEDEEPQQQQQGSSEAVIEVPPTTTTAAAAVACGPLMLLQDQRNGRTSESPPPSSTSSSASYSPYPAPQQGWLSHRRTAPPPRGRRDSSSYPFPHAAADDYAQCYYPPPPSPPVMGIVGYPPDQTSSYPSAWMLTSTATDDDERGDGGLFPPSAMYAGMAGPTPAAAGPHSTGGMPWMVVQRSPSPLSPQPSLVFCAARSRESRKRTRTYAASAFPSTWGIADPSSGAGGGFEVGDGTLLPAPPQAAAAPLFFPASLPYPGAASEMPVTGWSLPPPQHHPRPPHSLYDRRRMARGDGTVPVGWGGMKDDEEYDWLASISSRGYRGEVGPPSQEVLWTPAPPPEHSSTRLPAGPLFSAFTASTKGDRFDSDEGGSDVGRWQQRYPPPPPPCPSSSWLQPQVPPSSSSTAAFLGGFTDPPPTRWHAFSQFCVAPSSYSSSRAARGGRGRTIRTRRVTRPPW